MAKVTPDFIVSVDAELEKILPDFINQQYKHLADFKVALKNRDFFRIARMGHSMKGSCGSYGFHTLGEFGEKIEKAALFQNDRAMEQAIGLMEDYLARMKIQINGK